MQTSYLTAKAFTKAEEGGWTGDSRDSGNWTTGVIGQGNLVGSKFGCGAPATSDYMAETQPGFIITADWMKELPESVYDGMALSRYWMPLQCDALPAGLDLQIFDDSFNTGVSTAAKKLQRVLGAQPDGLIGNVTLGLIQTFDAGAMARCLTYADAAAFQKLLGVTRDGEVGPVTLAALAAQPKLRIPLLILALGEAQVSYYRSLSNFTTYGAGWLARTSRRVEAALALASPAT